MGNTKSSEEEPSKEPRGSVLKDKIKYQNGRRVSKVAKLSRASLSSQGSTTTLKKPIMSLAQRQIIKSCMDNAKDDIADRIYRRIYEKRDDFKAFVDALNDV
ncbi:unnamed protein product [Enterobius vermicularis]|uniref:Uncharacterized protein n=1 Tax=Enterobius vermicularis TaxID=51028 RepID=A0A0N4VM81_ENTVE|nr:unnamed protein product [Enterobius vermicularis]